MVKVVAQLPFDQNSIDLHLFAENAYSIEFYNDGGFSFAGKTYSDGYVISSELSGYYYAVAYLGESMTVDSSKDLTGGVITAIDEVVWDGYTWIPYISLTGVSISAKRLQDAIDTPSTKDDRALINGALNGNDQFYLSDYEDYGDKAYGFGGKDKMFGKAGNDSLWGGAGNDILAGGRGNDKLYGGAGQDESRGDTGQDTFMFTRIDESARGSKRADVILDFSGEQDQINLKKIDAFAKTDANDSFVWNGTVGFSSATSGEVRYQKFDKAGTKNDYTMVYLDNDRDTAAEMAIRLKGLHDLTAEDFVL
jgi:Ca2+-binding RTX toxin-like protein